MDDNEIRNNREVSAPEGTNAGRDKNGRWAKGNPGKPHGARFKAVLAAEALLDGELEGLTRKCIDAAHEGDMTAMRLAMDRALPLRRSRPVHFEMPLLKTAADAPIAIASIVQATAAGELTPEEAEIFTRLVEGFVRITDLADLEQRVRAIELATSR